MKARQHSNHIKVTRKIRLSLHLKLRKELVLLVKMDWVLRCACIFGLEIWLEFFVGVADDIFFLVIQIFIKAQNTGHSLNTEEPIKGIQ